MVLYYHRFIILFTQIIHKKQTHIKNKENIFNLTVQYLEKYSSTVQQLAYRGWLALSEQAIRVTDWRRERRWEMVELKDHQQ